MIPFTKILTYGNDVNKGKRYLGIIPDSVFSYDIIKGILNPSNTLVLKQNNFRSYKFLYEDKEYILPSQPIAIASYKEVYEKGMVWGTNDNGPDIFDTSSGVTPTIQNATTTINGIQYKVRLMRGSLVDTISVLENNPKYEDPMTEWELFVYSIWSNLENNLIPGYQIPEEDKIPHVANVSGTGTRRWTMVQGSDGNRTQPRTIGRARFETTAATGGGYGWSQICSTSIAPLWTAAQDLWWPIFERVYE